MLLDLAEYSSLLVLLGMHLSHLLEESSVCGRQCLQGSYKMVMEGSDVIGATGGTVGDIGRAAEVASGMGTCGAEVIQGQVV